MALSTAKLTELPLRNTIPLTSHSPSSLHIIFFHSFPRRTLSFLRPFSSLRSSITTKNPRNNEQRYPWDDDLQNPSKNPGPYSPKSKGPSAPWLNKWPTPSPPVQTNLKTIDSKRSDDGVQSRYVDGKNATSAIERIVLRLRNLGLGSDDEEEEEENENVVMPVTGEEKLGDLLKRDWVRPDTILEEDEDETVLPWEREVKRTEKEEESERGAKKRPVKAPTLAELTIEDEELRRLRRLGMTIRERINVPKAGVTAAVLDKIHEKWRVSELVRLKFHETLATDMKTAHEIVEVSGF